MVQGVIRAMMGLRMLALLAVLLLAACARQSVLVDALDTPAQALDVPAGDALMNTPAASLLVRADEAFSQGNVPSASRYLERAIQIAPRSSWLYKRMAELRLDDGDGYAAEGFVRHAMRNAPADQPVYQASLWRLLATCLAQQGKHGEAKLARDRAEQLEGQP